jgi:hypothetical protein
MNRTSARRGALIVTLGLALGAAPAPHALAAGPATQTFTFTGAEQQFTVPAGVSSIHVVLIGGRGGAYGSLAAGGMGARVEGDLAVSPGMQLFIEVGGNGPDDTEQQTPGGFNGGGVGGGSETGLGYAAGGGGASDIRTVSRTFPGTLESRLVIAAGGGGAAWSSSGSAPGGNAGQPGGGPGNGGSPGTASAGGAGGPASEGMNGFDGVLGVGGGGGNGWLPGGGGGGGRYGGGGGAAGDPTTTGMGGGGGGGSSFTDFATSASVSVDLTGVPSVAITYVSGGSEPGSVQAQVDVAESAACLELNTTAVDFGTLPLGAQWFFGSPEIQLTNCGVLDQTVMVRGTDASSPEATWQLVDFTDCADSAMGFDTYGLGIQLSELSALNVIETNRELDFMLGGENKAYNALISTACPGSSGAGSLLTMQFVFTATESVQ